MILLDTHILVRLVQGTADGWAADCERGLIAVSPMSAAEIGCLVRLGRLDLSAPPDAWFDLAVAAMGARVLPLTSGLLARAMAFEWLHRDPADRVLVQTLREYPDATLYTRDRAVLDYGAATRLAMRDCRV